MYSLHSYHFHYSVPASALGWQWQRLADVNWLSCFGCMVVQYLFCVGGYMMGLIIWQRFSYCVPNPTCSCICLYPGFPCPWSVFLFSDPNQPANPFAMSHEFIDVFQTWAISSIQSWESGAKKWVCTISWGPCQDSKSRILRKYLFFPY